MIKKMITWAVSGLSLVFGVVLAGYLLPINRVNWGSVTSAPPEVVSVSGEAKSRQKNQIATFNAGVMVTKDKREEATAEMNKKMEELTTALKTFGIKSEDIKTTNISYNQNQEYYSESGVQKWRPGTWSASSNVEVTLREVEKTSTLADLLAGSGANNVYGPNFALDNTLEFEKALVDEALTNAKSKAEAIAKASGKKLGKVLTVTEASSGGMGMYAFKGEGMGGGGTPVETGSGTVSKTLYVVFELK